MKDWDVIFTYTRKQALADGVLVDVTEAAKEAGFKVPVAVTVAVWEIINNIPERSYQDVSGRLWDVLYMLTWKIAKNRNASIINFDLIMERIETRQINAKGTMESRKVRNLTLKAVIGPGDEGEQVLTIMLPDED